MERLLPGDGGGGDCDGNGDDDGNGDGESDNLKSYKSGKAGVMRGAIVAVGAGFMWYAFITNCRRYREQYCYHDRRFIIYASYALAFWYGVKLIMDDRDLCEEVRAG